MKKINVALNHADPSISLPSPSVYVWASPHVLSLSPSPLSVKGLWNSFLSSNHASAFFPPPTLFSLCFFFHSFIFYCLNSNSHHIALELFLIITSLSASICIPLASLSLGISLLSLPLSPCTPPYRALSLSLCWCLPVSPLFLLAHVRLIALPLLLPYSFSSFSLFFSLALTCFFLIPSAKSCNEVWQTLLP